MHNTCSHVCSQKVFIVLAGVMIASACTTFFVPLLHFPHQLPVWPQSMSAFFFLRSETAGLMPASNPLWTSLYRRRFQDVTQPV